MKRWWPRLGRIGLAGWAGIFTIIASIVTVIAFVQGGESTDESSGSGTPTESVEQFGERVLGYYHGGNYDAVWELFHPAVKDVIPERAFELCEQRAGKPTALLGLELASISEAAVSMEGVPATSSAVTYNVRSQIGERRITVPETVFVVNDGHLNLVPIQRQYNAYRAETCPTPEAIPDDPGPEAPESGEPADVFP